MTFSKKLITWYLQNKRAMPWRETKDPYNIWLSEIILQQTRVAQGLPYYLTFLENFPKVFDLAEAEEEKVLKLWQGLGYYSRARNLHASAKYVVSELNGVFPDTYRELLKLKGVGDYTASAIASICFDEAVPVVDGNVYRVLSRYYGIDTPINSSKGIKEFKNLAIEIMDTDDPANYNQAIMEFGALQCKPQSPYCIICPLNDSCLALEKQLVASLPVKINKLKIKKRYFNYLVFVIDQKETIIQQRVGKGIWQNLYEFPLIETLAEITVEKLEEHKVFRELLNGKDYTITLYKENQKPHKLSHQHLYVKFFIINVEKTPEMIGSQKLINQNTIDQYPAPILIGNFVEDFF